MPVTCYPAPHGATAWSYYWKKVPRAADLLEGCSSQEFATCKTLLASSFSSLDSNSTVFASSNGFVNSVVDAYNHHHHLRIRPEDLWFSILSQLSLYINANAELLRDKFVTHTGQKNLKVMMMGTLTTVDYAEFFFQMGKEIENNVVDVSLRKWVLPAFTTTTKSDEAVASAILMGSMQKYFRYYCCMACGLPSVTLLGEKSDWETILVRLDKLLSFGKEPTEWCGLLKPVINGFIATFDAPNSSGTKDFWQRVAHQTGGGSGPSYLSGWITAFCFWDGEGKTFYEPGINPAETDDMPEKLGSIPVLVLEGARYHWIERGHVPRGYTSLPLQIQDADGTIYDARMLAGSVGRTLTSTGQKIEVNTNRWSSPNPYLNPDGSALDTVQPESGWFVYLTKTEEEMKVGKGQFMR